MDRPVVYRGIREEVGASAVLVESAAGEVLDALAHQPRHSPTGFQWGYAGSGPADLARCLLLAAIGELARCRTCGGGGRVEIDADGTERPPAADTDPELVVSCMACDEGSLITPAVYQRFKFDVIASLGPQWRMRQEEIAAWWQANQTTREQEG